MARLGRLTNLDERRGDSMPVLMIRYQVADEGVAEIVDAIEAAFKAVKTEQPEGIRYAYLRRAGTYRLLS
jgi:hypothetical protein